MAPYSSIIRSALLHWRWRQTDCSCILKREFIASLNSYLNSGENLTVCSITNASFRDLLCNDSKDGGFVFFVRWSSVPDICALLQKFGKGKQRTSRPGLQLQTNEASCRSVSRQDWAERQMDLRTNRRFVYTLPIQKKTWGFQNLACFCLEALHLCVQSACIDDLLSRAKIKELARKPDVWPQNGQLPIASV